MVVWWKNNSLGNKTPKGGSVPNQSDNIADLTTWNVNCCYLEDEYLQHWIHQSNVARKRLATNSICFCPALKDSQRSRMTRCGAIARRDQLHWRHRTEANKTACFCLKQSLRHLSTKLHVLVLPRLSFPNLHLPFPLVTDRSVLMPKDEKAEYVFRHSGVIPAVVSMNLQTRSLFYQAKRTGSRRTEQQRLYSSSWINLPQGINGFRPMDCSRPKETKQERRGPRLQPDLQHMSLQQEMWLYMGGICHT